MTSVADLTGAELEYWVARAEGIDAEQLEIREVPRTDLKICVYTEPPILGWMSKPQRSLAYSTVWAQGGPLIEKHRIWLQPVDAGGTWMGDHQPKAGWLARVVGAAVNERDAQPLIAAMRALVASVYGDEVQP